MAGLAPAIQSHTEFIRFFMDGPVKPGHDNRVLDDRADFFHALLPESEVSIHREFSGIATQP